MPELSRAQVVDQLLSLGIEPGGVLLVHTSYRAVRPLKGGPETLIDALLDALGPQGTLVMPSWSKDNDQVFDPASSSVAKDLGVVAQLFSERSGAVRADHAASFAAYGPHAREITADPLPIPPHIPASPVGRVHDLDGQVLLLGVGHDANTTVHLAEVLAGVKYGLPHHITVLRNGKPTRLDYFENDHCCRGFELLDGWLRQEGKQREGPVGHAPARLAKSQDVVSTALAKLREDPFVFLHKPGEGCSECDEARRNASD